MRDAYSRDLVSVPLRTYQKKKFLPLNLKNFKFNLK